MSVDPVIQEMTLLHQEQVTMAQQHFLPFIRHVNPDYLIAPHNRLLASKLEDVAYGRLKRLIVMMPPRHGKSEQASRLFPAWFMGKFKKRQVIATTYNEDMATDFGRDVRGILDSPEYAEIFPGVSLRRDVKAANRWRTTNGGIYVAAGAGGTITGRGADLLIIDDPLKNRQEADSITRLNVIERWFSSTAYTRLMPSASIVIIMTLWADMDLVGKRIKAMENGSEQWEVIDLPAICEQEGDALGRNIGDALWPEFYDIDDLLQKKSVLHPRDWSALYQQKPVPDEGDYFKSPWFNIIERSRFPALSELALYGASDYAVTDQDGDWTEHGVVGIDREDAWWFVDWWRAQATADVWIETQIKFMKRYRPRVWFGEKGPIRASVEPFLKRRMREERCYTKIDWLPVVNGNKVARARAFQGIASMGRIHVPENAAWLDEWIRQHLRFPAGQPDDIVDTTSLLGRGMEMMHPRLRTAGSDPMAEEKRRRNSRGWDAAFSKATRGSNMNNRWTTR